jgi:hypothetical protein
MALDSKLRVSKRLKSVVFNFDCCNKINEDAIEILVENICQNTGLNKLALPDRSYSPNFMNACIKIIRSSPCYHSMIKFTCGAM